MRRDRGARRARAADRADREPRAHRLHGAEAPLAAHATSPRRTRASGTCCCRRTTCASGSPASTRSTPRTRPARCSSTSPGVAGRKRSAQRSTSRSTWLPPAHESTEIAGAGDQAAAALGVGIVEPRACVGRARHLRRRLRRPACLRARRGGARACLLPRGARHLARDGRDAERGGLARLAAPGCSAPTTACSTRRRRAGRPGTEGLLFAPYLAGERTPHADPDARGAFTGLSLRHDRGALARATLEGVAYGLRDSLELLRDLGVRPSVGRASGGGAASELWLRIVASVLGAAARADGVGGRIRLRSGASRRRARRRLRGRRRCGRPLRARSRPDRAGPGVVGRLRARLRPLPVAVSQPETTGGDRHEPAMARQR